MTFTIIKLVANPILLLFLALQFFGIGCFLYSANDEQRSREPVGYAIRTIKFLIAFILIAKTGWTFRGWSIAYDIPFDAWLIPILICAPTFFAGCLACDRLLRILSVK